MWLKFIWLAYDGPAGPGGKVIGWATSKCAALAMVRGFKQNIEKVKLRD